MLPQLSSLYDEAESAFEYTEQYTAKSEARVKDETHMAGSARQERRVGRCWPALGAAWG